MTLHDTTLRAATRTEPRRGVVPGRRPAATGPAGRRGLRPRLVSLAQRLGALAVGLGVWTWFAQGPGAAAEFPTPWQTLVTALGLAGTGDYWSTVGQTLLTSVIGFLLSIAVGVPLGLVIGSSRRAQLSSQFLVDFGRTIPGIAILPILLLMFGNTRSMAVSLIVFGAVWPLLVQSTYAAQQVTPQMRQVARAFHLSTTERVRFIYVPSALPFLMTGLRIAATISLLLSITAEFLGQTDGIGRMLRQMYEIGDPGRMFVYMFTAALLGVVLNIVPVAIQGRVLWWHPSQRGKVR